MLVYYIYKITNDYNDKVYIGSTNNLKNRWRQHKQRAKDKPDYYLHRMMAKNGIDRFTFKKIKTLEDKTLKQVRKIERLFIEKYNSIENGYNSRSSILTDDEKKQYHNEKVKEAYFKNPDRKKQYQKEYHQKNKIRLNKERQERRIRNKNNAI